MTEQNQRHPHLVLGVEPDASAEEIRAAYKRLALRWHPDLNKSKQAGARMAEINAAFDAITRTAGDSPPSNGPHSPGAPPPPGYAGGMTEEELRRTVVACERCGRSDTTLRVSVMVVVRSFIGSWRSGAGAELLCKGCRSSAAAKANAQSALLGWWGWAGIVLVPLEAVRNARGGRQSRVINDEILLALAQTRRARGDSVGHDEALAERLVVSQARDDIGGQGRLTNGGAIGSLISTAIALLIVVGAVVALGVTAGPTPRETRGSIEETRAALDAAAAAWEAWPTDPNARCDSGWRKSASGAVTAATGLESPEDPVGRQAVHATRTAANSVLTSLEQVCPQLPLTDNSQIDRVNANIRETYTALDSATVEFNRWVAQSNG